MSDLKFNNVSKEFGDGVTAVDAFTLTVPGPSMVVLVGPSGCGKTTLLRMIAGLETPTTGEIYLGDQRLDTLPPRERDIAMVFQSYALYPHMTVRDNLSFGLRLRKLSRDKIAKSVEEVAKTLEIDQLLDRKPAELSGGQRQRVALGRAIIRQPRVFLFDEPLSNLDARLRDEMRASIKRLYQRLKTTSIYVTHDQVEAMTIGELLVVMNAGRIRQVGTPTVCYHEPADTFVATFLGSPSMNLITGRLERSSGELVSDDGARVEIPPSVIARAHAAESVTLGFRPEDAHATPTGEAGVVIAGSVTLEEPLGHESLTHVSVGASNVIARGREGFAGGEGSARLYIRNSEIHLFDADSGARLSAT